MSMYDDSPRTIKDRWNPPGQTIDCSQGGRTQQHFKDDCDINLIVKRHAQTGMWSHLSPIAPSYGDFTQAYALEDAIQLVDQAHDDFAQLPATVRLAAGNDPNRFLEMLADPHDFHELVEAGMPVVDGYTPPQPPLPLDPPVPTDPEGGPPPE